MNMNPNQRRKLAGTVNLVLAVSLIFCCLVFLGGIRTERNDEAATISAQTNFAIATVAGTGSEASWRQAAEKHPELLIRAACTETRE
ncbi:MAG: hypothetical protein PHQ27_07055, partial [Victivallales bacterium]|nr:hypothetical protein [Victivallales bacterium]